jgi:hypothetical protein
MSCNSSPPAGADATRGFAAGSRGASAPWRRGAAVVLAALLLAAPTTATKLGWHAIANPVSRP